MNIRERAKFEAKLSGPPVLKIKHKTDTSTMEDYRKLNQIYKKR